MHETLRRDRVGQLSTLAGGHVVVALFRLSCFLSKPITAPTALSVALSALLPLWFTQTRMAKFWLRSDPDVGKIHGIVAAVIESFAASPTALNHSPAKRVIAAEWRSLQFLIRFRLEQGGLPRAPRNWSWTNLAQS